MKREYWGFKSRWERLLFPLRRFSYTKLSSIYSVYLSREQDVFLLVDQYDVIFSNTTNIKRIKVNVNQLVTDYNAIVVYVGCNDNIHYNNIFLYFRSKADALVFYLTYSDYFSFTDKIDINQI